MKKIIQFIIFISLFTQQGYASPSNKENNRGNHDSLNNTVSGLSFAEFRPIQVVGIHEPFEMRMTHMELSEPEDDNAENFKFKLSAWKIVPQVAYHTGLVQTVFDPWDNAEYIIIRKLPDGSFQRKSRIRNGNEFQYKNIWRINNLDKDNDIIE